MTDVQPSADVGADASVLKALGEINQTLREGLLALLEVQRRALELQREEAIERSAVAHRQRPRRAG